MPSHRHKVAHLHVIYPLSLEVYVLSAFNVTEFYVLPTQCIYVFCVEQTLYFPT